MPNHNGQFSAFPVLAGHRFHTAAIVTAMHGRRDPDLFVCMGNTVHCNGCISGLESTQQALDGDLCIIDRILGFLPELISFLAAIAIQTKTHGIEKTILFPLNHNRGKILKIQLSVSSDESRQINFDNRPKVILSASGMCEAGRIRHHLKHNLWSEKNTILFVGYQAEGSLGRKLQNGASTVRLFGEDIAVHAEIASLHGTSGHADQAGLIRWLEAFARKPKMVFVNHGDDTSCTAFQRLLLEKGYVADAPYSGTAYDLLTGKMIAYTDGKPIQKDKLTKGRARANAVYGDLLVAAEALLAFVKTCKGRTNKDNAKFAAQIRNLIEKWK